MDFLKQGEQLLQSQQGQDFLKKESSQFLGGDNNNNNSGDNQDQNQNQNQNQGNNANSSQDGQYNQYIQEGVQYTEKNVFNIDTNNMSATQKAAETKVTGFLSKEVDGYMSRE